MKFLLDRGLAQSTVAFLREQQDHDAVHLCEEGLQRLPDEEIIKEARQESRVIITHDLNFGRLIALSQSRLPGVITLRLDNMQPEFVNHYRPRFPINSPRNSKPVHWSVSMSKLSGFGPCQSEANKRVEQVGARPNPTPLPSDNVGFHSWPEVRGSTQRGEGFVQYRRTKMAGGIYFFTVVTHRRRKFLTQPDNVALLREAFREVMERHSAQIDTKAQQLTVPLIPFARVTETD